MAPINVSVLGAGVVGLTTALLLSKDKRYNVTAIGKHMPGDYDIEYASTAAGANYLPFSKAGTLLAQCERDTWPELARLVEDVPEAGIHFQEAVLYKRRKDFETPAGEWMNELMKEDAWFRNLVPNFRALSPAELPPGIDSGTSFTSVCININIYLPWLASQCLRHGVTIKRGVVKHIIEAASLHSSSKVADVVINCTGLGSLTLGGVEDRAMYPGRGQTVLVRNDPSGVMMGVSGTDDGGADEATYMMGRAAGGGTILGGCLQAGNWESQPDPNLAVRIMQRCVDLNPALTAGSKRIEDLSVIRHGVGLRPMREGGPRIEREQIKGGWVIHAYGHGGYGYQSSYGTAMEVVRSVEDIVRAREERAKL